MAKHDVDPVLQQLVHTVDDSGRSAELIAVSAHGMSLTGTLISEQSYFRKLAEVHPLLSALEPSLRLLGQEYVTEAEAESGHHLHMWGSEVSDGKATRDGWAMADQPGGGGQLGPAPPDERREPAAAKAAMNRATRSHRAGSRPADWASTPITGGPARLAK
jgi:hypothetical protein